jgi:glucosamine 6-phosphate synthetase-like amidotransferase/phosphosugar isomerase protein
VVDLRPLVEQARHSELFTAPRLEADLARFLAEHTGQIKALAAEAVASGMEQVYFVGCGGSWSNMFSGKYLLDRFTTLSSDVLTSYESIWRNPQRLNSRAWVFLASYSGGTEDTGAAPGHARDRGARTIAIVRRRGLASIWSKRCLRTRRYGRVNLAISCLTAERFTAARTHSRPRRGRLCSRQG